MMTQAPQMIKKILGLPYMPQPENDKSHIISQPELNDLVRDLTLLNV